MGVKCLFQGHTAWNLYKVDSRIKIPGGIPGGSGIRTWDLPLGSLMPYPLCHPAPLPNIVIWICPCTTEHVIKVLRRKRWS